MKINLLTQQAEPQISPGLVTLFLTGEININMASVIAKDLMEIEASNRELKQIVNEVQLIINSPGGDLYSTFMICDIMSTMFTPVHTIGMGQVASGGFMIFMNGNKGKRIASKNTQFMSHPYSMMIEASYPNIKAQTPEFHRIFQRILDHYKKCTKLPFKKIEKYLLNEHDVWLSAEDCLQYNICDDVIDVETTWRAKQKL